MQKIRISALVVAIFLSVAASSRATTISYSATFAPNSNSINVGTGYFLTGFSTQLGTLTGVEVTLSFHEIFAGAFISVMPSAPAAVSFAVSRMATAAPIGGATPLSGLSVTLQTPAQTYTNIAPGSSAAFGPYDLSGSAVATINPVDFLFFEGPSWKTVLANSESASLGVERFPNGQIASLDYVDASGLFVKTVSAIVKVDYTYTPSSQVVPEPMSLAVLGAGIICLSVVRRRSMRAPH